MNCPVQGNLQQQKKRPTKLKFSLNYNPIVYSVRTKQRHNELGSYASYGEARTVIWKCNKCDRTFAGAKYARAHKQGSHTY